MLRGECVERPRFLWFPTTTGLPLAAGGLLHESPVDRVIERLDTGGALIEFWYGLIS